jgi:hypothetical protein
LEKPILVKESFGAGAASENTPCGLSGNTNGTCANYRWYNICSGYIWIYSLAEKEAFGVQFGGPEQPCVAGGNTIKRTILYYRNVISSVGYAFRVFVDTDENADGCPDSVIAWRQFYDPELRWNCVEFGVPIPDGIDHVIVRAMKWDSDGDASAFTVASDGPRSTECDPTGVGRTFYYGVNGSACQPWR